MQEFALALGGKLQMKTPEVATVLGVSLSDEAGAVAPTSAPTAPRASGAHMGAPLSVDQMKSSKYKLVQTGIEKGVYVRLSEAGSNSKDVYEVTDVTDTTVHMADANASVRASVGTRVLPPKTVSVEAELEKKTMTLVRAFKRQKTGPPCSVDLAAWDVGIVVGICVRGVRIAHDKHCEALASITILESPTAVYLTGAMILNRVACACVWLVALGWQFALGVELKLAPPQGDTKYKKGELTLVATSTRIVMHDAGAAWANKPKSAIDMGTITLQREGSTSAFKVAVMPHFIVNDDKSWVTPYWQLSEGVGGNMKQSFIEVVLTDNLGTHKLNVPCATNTKEVKPGATTTTTTTMATRGVLSLPGDELKFAAPPQKGVKRKAQ